MPSDTNVPLLTGEKKEPAVTQDNPVVEVETAFLVYKTPDGLVQASPDINLPVVTRRPANGNDMLSMCGDVITDITISNTAMLAAQHTVQAQMQMARQAMESRQNQEVISQLGGLAK